MKNISLLFQPFQHSLKMDNVYGFFSGKHYFIAVLTWIRFLIMFFSSQFCNIGCEEIKS